MQISHTACPVDLNLFHFFLASLIKLFSLPCRHQLQTKNPFCSWDRKACPYLAQPKKPCSTSVPQSSHPTLALTSFIIDVALSPLPRIHMQAFLRATNLFIYAIACSPSKSVRGNNIKKNLKLPPLSGPAIPKRRAIFLSPNHTFNDGRMAANVAWRKNQ